MDNNYNINYEDERLQKVETDKNTAMTENENLYSGMIDSIDQHYKDQIQASKDMADKQSQLQQEQTDLAVEKLEQQKEQAEKDYQREQSGAYIDWQKQSNRYGVNAEKIASAGLQNSGYAESSQVAMYTAYQNRVATARAAYQQATLNFDNAMKEARLQNNSVQAQIALTALQTQLELALQGLQYRNQLLLDKANKKLAIDEMYYGRRQDVLAQLNAEYALANLLKGGSSAGGIILPDGTQISNGAALTGPLAGAIFGSGNESVNPWAAAGALIGSGFSAGAGVKNGGTSGVINAQQKAAIERMRELFKVDNK